jgi:DNA transposition AAA+ family ATPase
MRPLVHKAWRDYEILTGYVQNVIELGPDSRPYWGNSQTPQLVIVDEADRLKTQGLEQIRDIYDRRQIGLVLIGMPGIEKRLSRYPQLYSRVGFVHHYALLKPTEVEDILRKQWGPIDGSTDPGQHTDREVIATIIRTVGGNFRLLRRLMEQTARLMQINDLHVMTKDVVEAARELIIIGRYSAT